MKRILGLLMMLLSLQMYAGTMSLDEQTEEVDIIIVSSDLF